MSKNTLLSELINYISANSSGNVVVAAPSSGLALDVTGTGRFTGALTLGSTITNGTFTYTLPSATGTLALTSSLGSYLPLSGGTLTGALSGTSASFSGAISSTITNNAVLTASASTTNRKYIEILNDGGQFYAGIGGNTPATIFAGQLAYSTTIGSANATALEFGTNATIRLSIASTGAATFSSSVNAATLSINTTTYNGAFAVIRGNNSTPATSGTTTTATLRLTSGTGLYNVLDFGTNESSDYAWIQSTRANSLGTYDKLLLNPNGGNVGIGTTSPTASIANRTVMVVRGGSNGAELNLQSTSATDGTAVGFALTAFSTDAYYINRLDGNHIWLSGSGGNTERMRINSSGRIIIGATSPTDNASLTVAPVSGSDTGQISIVGGASSGNPKLYLEAPGINGAGMFYDRSASLLKVWVGTQTNGVSMASFATSWSSYSDERLKTNLVPIDNALDKIKNIRPFTGRYKTDEEGISRSFLIAQDIIKVFPEAIHISDDEIKTLSLRYTDMIPLMLKAIQEQQEIIEQLKNK